jgi:predicted CoA-binding protein
MFLNKRLAKPKKKKKTVVLGASLKEERYSNSAVKLLRKYGHPVVAIGLRQGTVADVIIKKGKPKITDVHTVTMYINPKRQPEYYDYILSLSPKRIIFNPGTENQELTQMAVEKNIEVVEHCTLVMLISGLF